MHYVCSISQWCIRCVLAYKQPSHAACIYLRSTLKHRAFSVKFNCLSIWCFSTSDWNKFHIMLHIMSLMWLNDLHCLWVMTLLRWTECWCLCTLALTGCVWLGPCLWKSVFVFPSKMINTILSHQHMPDRSMCFFSLVCAVCMCAWMTAMDRAVAHV